MLLFLFKFLKINNIIKKKLIKFIQLNKLTKKIEILN